MKLTLHSDEVNLLIYRYLQESGFVHTAFALGTEANLLQPINVPSSVSGSSAGRLAASTLHQLGPKLPPNCLVSMLQKALLYIWIEHHTDPDTGAEIPCNQPFGLFHRHECRFKEEKEMASDSDSDDEEQQPQGDTGRGSGAYGGAGTNNASAPPNASVTTTPSDERLMPRLSPVPATTARHVSSETSGTSISGDAFHTAPASGIRTSTASAVAAPGAPDVCDHHTPTSAAAAAPPPPATDAAAPPTSSSSSSHRETRSVRKISVQCSSKTFKRRKTSPSSKIGEGHSHDDTVSPVKNEPAERQATTPSPAVHAAACACAAEMAADSDTATLPVTHDGDGTALAVTAAPVASQPEALSLPGGFASQQLSVSPPPPPPPSFVAQQSSQNLRHDDTGEVDLPMREEERVLEPPLCPPPARADDGV